MRRVFFFQLLFAIVFIHSATMAADCSDPNLLTDIPVIPTSVSDNLISLYEKGIAEGNDPKSMLILGDCQSIPSVFLGPFVNGSAYNLGDFAYLQETIDQFGNSFVRQDQTRKGGMTIAGVLTPSRSDPTVCKANESPLDCDLRLFNPSLVLITLEEWWGGRPVSVYEQYLRQVIEKVIGAKAVPILSTKADNLEGGNEINNTIIRIACEESLPVWNFYAAAQKLPNRGVWKDNFHLTVGDYNFSDTKLITSGRSTKNLTGLQSIDAVWRLLTHQTLHD